MSAAASRSRRFLALYLPFLTTDRLRQAGRLADAPTAIVEIQRGAMRLVAVCPQAARLGILPGLMLADARARLPELAAIDHDPQADTRWLDRLADLAERWTPMVAPDGPDGLTLDITGHPFGSEARLVAEVEAVLAHAGCTLRHACAGSPEAAQALARHQTAPAPDEAAAIRRLPLAALCCEAEVETALARAGLKTIGDLASRPTAPLAARFGEGLTAMLARLLGRSDSRIVPRRVPPALLCERRFAEPIARTEHVLAVIDDLVAEAAIALEERHGGGRRFAVRLYRSDGAVRDLAVETGLPTRDPAVTARLFRERIDALADPIDPGFGFDLIRLAVPRVEPVAATQLQLEGGGVSEEAMAALVDRLSTRLGRQRVRRVRAVDTHIPEQQTLALPAIQLAEPLPWTPPVADEPPLRPLHLFDPPQRIEVTAYGVPDGPPSAFRWRRGTHEVLRFEGPERIAGEWWRVGIERLPDPPVSVTRPSAGRDAMECDEVDAAASEDRPEKGLPLLTRDYFRVEDRRGRRFWLFRHGLLGRETAAPAWYLHGLFA